MFCKGCGAKLQTNDPHATGYVKDTSHIYCLSCFRLRHYNISLDPISETHFPKLPKGAFIVYMISALHLNSLFSYDLSKFYPESKIILLINQIDLLPQTVDFDRWIDYIKKIHKSHLSNVLEIMPISALKGTYVDIFLETLDHYNQKDTYFIGLQNSGKSTLLNQLGKHIGMEVDILSGKKPGLTLENIKIPYKNRYFIDTPGVYQKGNIGDYLSYQAYKAIIPDKRIDPKTFQLTNSSAFIIGGVAIISVIKGLPLSVTFYTNISIHRTKYEKAYPLFKAQKHVLFAPVIDTPFEKSHLKVSKGKHIINIYDIGYLVISSEATLEVYAPIGANIKINEGQFHGL